MRISVVVPDGIMLVDGVPRAIDMKGFETINAIQWFGDHGDIEYAETTRKNERITDSTFFQILLDRWTAAAPPPIVPPPPPTKDDLIGQVFSNPVLKTVLVELAIRAGIADETALRTLIRNKMP